MRIRTSYLDSDDRNIFEASNITKKTDALEANLINEMESELSFYGYHDRSTFLKGYFKAKHNWFEAWSRAYFEVFQLRAFLCCLFQDKNLLSTAISFFDCETMEKFWAIGSGNARRYQWNSKDMAIEEKKLNGVFCSKGDQLKHDSLVPLQCEFFESWPYQPILPRDYLTVFHNQRHGEANSNQLVLYRAAEKPSDPRWRTNRTQYTYPYVGKIENGCFSMHPPANPGFCTTKIQVCTTGYYMIPELGVRRIYTHRGTVRFIVFPGEWKGEAIGIKKGKIENIYFGRLKKDDEIFIAIDWGKEQSYAWDMCEVEFTLFLLS